MLGGEGGAAGGYDVGHAALVHGYDIGVAFDEEYFVVSANLGACLIYAVEVVGFVVEVGLRGVEVFGVDSFCGGVEHTSSESYDLAGGVDYGEDDPSAEIVVIVGVFFVFANETYVGELLWGVAVGCGACD